MNFITKLRPSVSRGTKRIIRRNYSQKETFRGRVKWFNEQKGYGFIQEEKNNKDYFVHATDIKMEGFKVLKPDQGVTFTIDETPRGSKCTNVVPESIKKD